MIRNYLVVAIRNIFRHFSVSFMNITGLSIGLACTMLIYLWVTDELAYDRFHQHADQLYRVEEDQHYSNGVYHVQVTPWPSGPVWRDNIPEIQQACRITSTGSFLITRNEKSFYEEKISAVDSTFFDMFSFTLLSGNPRTALNQPGSMVISDEMALKYFGGENPVGKNLLVNNKEVFQVTGVMKKMPANSSIDQDFLIPFDYMKKSNWYSDGWGNNSIATYVMLQPNADPRKVDVKLTQIARQHNPDGTTQFVIEPMTRIHLYSYWGFGHKPGAILNVWIFSSIALLVLIIACINFMNLSTARSAARAKEIGLRKVNGAHRQNLILQFFGESLLTTLISMLIAFVIALLLLEPFNRISGKFFHIPDLLTVRFLAGMVVITLLTGLLAGTYPALVLSGFKPINTLKGVFGMGSTGNSFRKVSVMVQFALSIMLIAGTIVIYRQLRLLQSQRLGYDKENLLYIPLRGELKNAYPVIKEELLREPVVKFITASTDPPHQIGSNSDNASWEGKSPDADILVSMSGVDFDYVETMGIEMKAGRAFSKSYASDVAHDTLCNFLINEQMEKVMGMENAVGARLKFGSSGTIVGVMKDYNFQSLHNKIEPLAISIWGPQFWNFMYIRINPGNLTSTMNQLEKAWKRVMPMYPFDYHFVDQEFDNTYRIEERMQTLMNYFAGLAILIAAIGLFGMATFTVEQKTREVGIRKALGAPAMTIFNLFTWQFMQLLLVAVVISVPVSWYLLSHFLKNYSYHTSLSAWIFILAASITLVVAMTSISYQTIRAIRTNPAETLKHE
jgi:putative ABC transport system permease protein